MISDDDVVKIRKALKPDFDRLDQKIGGLDQKMEQSEKNIKSEIKQYIHEGIDAVATGIDNLLSEYQFDSRIKKLEKIHPSGRHRQID